MRIGKIADRVAFYLQKDRASFIDANGNDMIIAALNTARRNAELQHDFIYQQKMAILSVDPSTGGLLSNATEWDGQSDTAIPLHIKAVDTVYLGGGSVPESWSAVYHSPKKALAIAAKEDNYRYSFDYNNRYRPDFRAFANTSGFQTQVYFQGERLVVAPKLSEARNVLLDVQAWLPNYTANQILVLSASEGSASVTISGSAPGNVGGGQTVFLGQTINSTSESTIILNGNANQTITQPTWVHYTNVIEQSSAVNEDYSDWFTDNAEEYLLWSGVLECNMFVRQFVSQAAGFLAPPEKARNAAYESLIMWDDFQWASGLQPGALNP